MDQKTCLKKKEDVTSELMRKAWELSISYEIDVACIVFSPCGEISKFCMPKRIDEVIHRYVNLPPDTRYIDMDNAQEKIEKLRQLDLIEGEKAQYLDKQVENLEQKIEKSMLLLNILEADMRVFEPRQDEEPNLDQLIRNEIYLKRSLEKVKQRKNTISIGNSRENLNPQMAVEGVRQHFNLFGSNSGGSFPLKSDNCTAPHSAEVPEAFLQSLTNKEKGKSVQDQGIAASTYNTREVSEENPQFSFLGGETQFVPTMENGFTSVTQYDQHIPSLNKFDGTSNRILHDIHPLNIERNTSVPLHNNLSNEKFEARIDKTFYTSEQLNNLCETEPYIPVLEQFSTPPSPEFS